MSSGRNLVLAEHVNNLDYFEFESTKSSPKRNGGYVLLVISSGFFLFDLFLFFQFGGIGMSVVGVPLLLTALVLINSKLTVRVEKDVVIRVLNIFFFRKETSEPISKFRYVRMSCRPAPVSPAQFASKYFHVDLCISKTPYWRPGDLAFFHDISFDYDVNPEEYFSFVDKIIEVTGNELFAGPDLPEKFKVLVQKRYGDI